MSDITFKIDPQIASYQGRTPLSLYAEKNLNSYTIKPIRAQTKLVRWVQERSRFFNFVVVLILSQIISRRKNCLVLTHVVVNPKEDVPMHHIFARVVQDKSDFFPKTSIEELVNNDLLADKKYSAQQRKNLVDTLIRFSSEKSQKRDQTIGAILDGLPTTDAVRQHTLKQAFQNLDRYSKEIQKHVVLELSHQSDTFKELACHIVDNLEIFPKALQVKTVAFIIENYEGYRIINRTLIKIFQLIFDEPDSFADRIKILASTIALQTAHLESASVLSAVSLAETMIDKHSDSSTILPLLKVISKDGRKIYSDTLRSKVFNLYYWINPDHFQVCNNRYQISINKGLIKDEPEKVLDRFYRYCFQVNKRLRLLKIKLIDNHFNPLPGIDEGGLSRQFLSDLFEALISSSTEILEFDGSLPAASKKTKNGFYRYLQDEKIQNLPKEELEEAVYLAYIDPNLIPETMKTTNGELDLCKAREHFSMIQATMPPLSDKEERLYEAIGKLMGMCLTSDSYLIGQMFDPSLYEVITSIDTKSLNSLFTQLNDDTLIQLYQVNNRNEKLFEYYNADELPDEVLYYAYLAEEDRPEELKRTPDLKKHFSTIKRALKQRIVEAARQDRTLPAIFSIAKGIASHYYPEKNWAEKRWELSCEQLVNDIQGVFSRDLFKNSIVCPNDRMRRFFHRWIDESSEEMVQTLVKAATGSPSLTASRKIGIQLYFDSGRLPVYRTCAKMISLPVYEDYPTFKQKLEQSLEHALGGDGFQIN